MLKVGVDVGGTFTDTYGKDGSAVFVGKSLTTPDDLSCGIINAIEASGLKIEDIDVLVHGSTIATNALIVRNYYGWWPRTVFVSTEGFRDTLEIRRGRNQLYGQIDMYGVAPDPLIERRYRLTIPEKVDVEGRVVKAPARGDVEKLIERLRAMQPDSIAICLINSYINPENELAVKKALQEAFPNVPVFASVEVAPKFRELGRMVTVTIRALLAPIVTKYMDRVEAAFAAKGFKGQLLMIKGDGGTCTVDFLKGHPEMLIASGPAAGVYAGEVIGKIMNEPNCLTQDTGGTSYDVCMIEDGKHATTMEHEIDIDMPLIVPTADVHSIGTGGGSIIWLDEGGSLRVGPQTAGAKPGPVCYGLGGARPTVTDANLILGRIDPTLGGKMQLDIEGAKKAFAEQLAKPLGKDVYEIAEGALNIACVDMARANALITTSRGRDPRRFLPILFGGAGGLLAAKVAGELGVDRAAIVPNAGVASAMGATMMPFSTYAEKTHYTNLDDANLESLNAEFRTLRDNVIDAMVGQGVSRKDVVTWRELHMRYVGQNYEVLVKDDDDGDYDAAGLQRLKQAFNEAHQKVRGISEPSFAVAIVDIRVMGVSSNEHVELPVWPPATDSAEAAKKGTRPAYFDGKFVETGIYDFDKLGNGHKVAGPAVIEMAHSCVVVPPDWRVRLDEHKIVLLERG